MWETSDNRWNTSTGPSSDELRESRGRELPLNQCIGAVISSLRLDERTWRANFDSLSNSSSSPLDHGPGGWGLRRFVSRSSLSNIYVQDNSGWSTRRLLASAQMWSTERTTAFGGDGMFLYMPRPTFLQIMLTYPQDYILLHEEPH